MRPWAELDERAEDELTDQALGTSAVLTADGWEEADYVEPGDDWRVLADGSYLSPDGTVRSWPLVGSGEV